MDELEVVVPEESEPPVDAVEIPHGNLNLSDEQVEDLEAPAKEVEAIEAKPGADEFEALGGEEPPQPQQEWSPPTQEEYEELLARERQKAAQATALQHRLGEVSADRRDLLSAVQGLQERLRPIEEQSQRQQQAAKTLEEQRNIPTDPAERYKYELLKSIEERVGGRVEKLEEKLKPVIERVTSQHQVLDQQARLDAYTGNLQARADTEDGGLSAEAWAQVQQWEMQQARHLMETQGLDQASARALAVQKRYEMYLQHWTSQHSGRADPRVSAPVALLEEWRAWGGGAAPNGGNGQPQQIGAGRAEHRRQLQSEEPIPAAGGQPPASGSPIDQIARGAKNGQLEGERLGAAVERAYELLKKKKPGLTIEDVELAIIDRAEQL